MKLGQKIAISYIRTKLKLLAALSKKRAAAKAFDLFCTPFSKTKKQTPAIFNKAEKLSLEVDGNTIRGHRWNKGGIKRILIAHGFESTSTNFDRYIQPLVEKNYEVLAFDAPAHGISGGKHITLPLYIETIRSIDARFGPIQGFITHSFAGLVVAHYLEKKPPDPTIKLVLMAPATEIKTAIDSFFSFLHLDAGVRKEFDALILKLGGSPPEYYSIPRVLENLRVSVLWIHDKEDDVTPLKDVQPVIDKHYPNIQFMITNGWGHRRVYKENKVVNAVVAFL